MKNGTNRHQNYGIGTLNYGKNCGLFAARSHPLWEGRFVIAGCEAMIERRLQRQVIGRSVPTPCSGFCTVHGRVSTADGARCHL